MPRYLGKGTSFFTSFSPIDPESLPKELEERIRRIIRTFIFAMTEGLVRNEMGALEAGLGLVWCSLEIETEVQNILSDLKVNKVTVTRPDIGKPVEELVKRHITQRLSEINRSATAEAEAIIEDEKPVRDAYQEVLKSTTFLWQLRDPIEG